MARQVTYEFQTDRLNRDGSYGTRRQTVPVQHAADGGIEDTRRRLETQNRMPVRVVEDDADGM